MLIREGVAGVAVAAGIVLVGPGMVTRSARSAVTEVGVVVAHLEVRVLVIETVAATVQWNRMQTTRSLPR
jgi:hypothetical protein